MPRLRPKGYPLPKRTSKYNVGGVLPRIRDRRRRTRFRLKGDTPVYDGGARELAISRGPVMLNSGAVKEMDVDGQGPETYLFAQKTGAGVTGWIRRSALVRPPPVPKDGRNPSPPSESDTRLVIDGSEGERRLEGLRFLDWHGFPRDPGANQAIHYTGRNLDHKGYVYLVWAAPNVRYGGIAKDSLPGGSEFVPSLNERRESIEELVPMYRGSDFRLRHKENVAFIYGRAPNLSSYGWIARGNVGEA